MEFWFKEAQSKDLAIGLRINKILHREETPYQSLAVVETLEFGRMLVLDQAIQ